MKKDCILIVMMTIALVLAERGTLFAWSDKITHPEITKIAAKDKSNLKNHLLNNLGFTKDLENMMFKSGAQNLSILNWLRYGAVVEDELPRGLNHFHEPISNSGLNDRTWLIWNWTGESNSEWASGMHDCTTPIENPSNSDSCNEYSWGKAREAYYAALTKTDRNDREIMYARTFRSLGQTMHLMEDMGVPAHTRNDMEGHIYWRKIAEGKKI